MNKRVLAVGNCNRDHQAIAAMLQSHFDVQVSRAHDRAGALGALEESAYDLVLVNRLMDRDGSEGLALIQSMKADGRWQDIPVMMITNFAEHQARAVEAGALPGFGKAHLEDSETADLLRPYLTGPRAASGVQRR